MRIVIPLKMENAIQQKMSYAEAVRHLRARPDSAELIRLSYLDADIRAAAARFAASEEWCELQRIVARYAPKRRLLVLDLGCGNGIAASAFAQAGHTVVALDPDPSSEAGLAAAAELVGGCGPGSIRLVQGSAEQLPFPDRMFDLVYTRQAMHHFRDLTAGTAECGRVLRSGGLFLGTREHVVDSPTQLAEFLEHHPMQPLHGGEYAYSLETYREALESAGLALHRVLRLYDSAINHFPILNGEVTGWLEAALARRFGHRLAHQIVCLPFVLPWYRRKLSRANTYAGRLNSFICLRR